MASQTKPSEICAILETIGAASLTAGTYNSTTWVEASDFQQYLGVFVGGLTAATGTLVFSLVQATDTAGTASKAISAATATITDDTFDDKQIMINLKTTDLDLANGFRFVGLQAVTATAATLGGAILMGFNPYHGPASDFNAAVLQVVN